MSKNKIITAIIFLSAAAIITAAGLFFIFNHPLTGDESKDSSSPFADTRVVEHVNEEIDKEKNIEEEVVEIEEKVVEEKEESQLQKNREKLVKAIYATSWSVSKDSYIDYIFNITKNTEINGVVIDIKDWSGYLAYDTSIPEAEKYGAKSIRIKNIKSLIQRLHQQGIYTIARITVFQDPVLAQARPEIAIKRVSQPKLLWLDNSGLAWIDPAAKECWDYNVAIAREAHQLGFDEINFDYIRFPSDGNLVDMKFPIWQGESSKRVIIKDFFQYVRQELEGIKISVDLFGLSTISRDDLGIGQVVEDTFNYFDYICPMIYPSHYANGFQGYQNPSIYPYEVVKVSLENALKRLSAQEEAKTKIRPWLQDFDLGAVYDTKMVESQIKAVYDALGEDFAGFMVWNSSNIYTEEAFNYPGN